jgi:hypothetical protein
MSVESTVTGAVTLTIDVGVLHRICSDKALVDTELLLIKDIAKKLRCYQELLLKSLKENEKE